MSSLRATGLQPGPSREERRVLHAGVSDNLWPIARKVLSFVLCIAVLPYGAHRLASALTTVPTMLDGEESNSVLPPVAAIVTLNAVILAFLVTAAMGDRRKLAEEEKREEQAKKAK